jgi:outer membrane protein TolC
MNTVLQAFALANNYEAKAQLTHILLNSPHFRGISASGVYLETSKIALKGSAANTVTNVKKAFYGVLLAEEMVNITEASLKNFEDNLNNLRSLKEQGLVSEYDLLQAEVQLENFRPRVLEAKNGLRNAKNGLKITMGIDQKDEIDIEGTLNYSKEEVPDIKQMMQDALDNNFDLLTLKNKRKVDEAMIDLDRSEYWPQLVGFADYTFGGASEDLNFQNFQSSLVGLQFQINLFQGGRTMKKVQQGKITVMQTDQQISQLQEAIKLQIQEKVLQLDRIHQNIEAQDKNINLAEKAYDIAKVRFREGTGTQLELLNAEIQLRTARTNRLQSVYEYIVANAELAKLRGSIDNKYIQMVNK